MNRFRIVKGLESEFEGIWKSRNTYLESEPRPSLASICLKDLRMKIMFFMLPTLHGSPNLTLLSGPSQKHSEKLTREPAVEVTLTGGHPEFEGFQVVEETSVFANEN